MSLPFAAEARAALGPALFDYMQGRAGDSHAAPGEDANAAAFARLRLIPRLFSEAGPPDLATELAGRRMAAPVMIGAFAGDRVFHAEGILPVARVAARLGLDLVLSEETVTPLAEVTAAHPGTWLQLRAAGSEDRIARIVSAAAGAGAAGIVLTLMAPSHPRPGQRPGGFDIGAELVSRGWSTIGTQLDGSHRPGVAPLEAFPRWDAARLGRIAALARSLGLPLMVKGVLNPADLAPLADCGVAGAVASNVGLRQSSRWALALDQLPALAAARPAGLPLLLDGGVRHGADVIAASLLGAAACVATRPVLCALAAGGEAAVEAWLNGLLDNLYAMTAWMGAAHPAALDPGQLLRD
ncbi:alpha-hydroxy-acid oxidizing protein [Mangrovicoccus sp. HB161399]|uniref:alpha-hydroxy-acid oxidizing protein n=1 Tax=Mangrovicoccus sp. HB161399 TaxID=2720392 RepID=UPI001557CE84|nr:alpha-hydroxy-acid oxidizing protein [Mangrovicoccus sp. HB161399]